MPIEQRNLDDRTYADLVEEARRLIPAYDPEWTDHNPSDPGITLIELFAYLTEILMYRMNRVTDANQTQFLKLLNGPDWTPSGDLAADTRAAVQRVRTRYRAVTPSDFELVATDDFNALLEAMRAAESNGDPLDAWWEATRLDPLVSANRPSEVPLVERARCVPGRNLDRGTEAERAQVDPGHVSLIVVPRDADAFHPPAPLREALRGFLDERRILTTRLHVMATSFAPIAMEIVLARTTDAVETSLHERVAQKLEHFLDPTVGGASQRGWPFGRDVYVSELIEQLENVAGVDYITDLMLFSVCDGNDDRCVPAPGIWHAEGDLVGLALAEHHLPHATPIDPAFIKSAPSDRFVAATITVNVTGPSADAATVKRAVKQQIRTFFHPLYANPDPAPNGNVEFKLAPLQTALEELPSVQPGTISLTLEADAQRLSTANGNVVGLVKAEKEMVDWRAVVTVSP